MGFKVVVCGGAGGIGQPLAMLMGMDDNVSELWVQDLDGALFPAGGVAADLSHIEKPAVVKSIAIQMGVPPVDQLQECLTGSHLVLIPAGVPRKPGMTRDGLFEVNAGIAKGLVEACAKWCPQAIIGLIVNPVNSVVPAMCEFYKKKGLDHTKIVGVTTLDCVRANKFIAQATGVNVNEVSVPVVGGHAGKTILPLFSQVPAAAKLPADQLKGLDERVQDAGTEVVEAKKGKGSATLSMAYAGARLGRAVLAGLSGQRTIECAYVPSNVCELPYFASKVEFGPAGVEKVFPLGPLNAYEETRLKEVKAQLAAEVQKGIDFASTL